MRAAVLRCREVVRRVVIAALSLALRDLGKRELCRGGPVDRVLVEGIGQVDQLPVQATRSVIAAALAGECPAESA